MLVQPFCVYLARTRVFNPKKRLLVVPSLIMVYFFTITHLLARYVTVHRYSPLSAYIGSIMFISKVYCVKSYNDSIFRLNSITVRPQFLPSGICSKQKETLFRLAPFHNKAIRNDHKHGLCLDVISLLLTHNSHLSYVFKTGNP